MEMGMVPKIRKRGCSSPSSTSSNVNNLRIKRAILVGKAKGSHGVRALGGSRCSTPVPSWKMEALRSSVESPGYSRSGKSRPVSARRLAATLWEMSEMETVRVVEKVEVEESKKEKKMEKLKSGFTASGSLPPHLSDPSHTPISAKMDRSGTGSRQRRTSAISQRLNPRERNYDMLESPGSARLMEAETRSRSQTVSRSVVGIKSRLKDVSNALTTSKELLKIINRILANAEQPSSSISLVSALHAELERGRLLVNQVIQEKHSDQNEISYLMKRFAEEKASWKNKELAVETAIESIAGELEVERKLRRRSESLNKKLGQELTETKTLFFKAVKELEGEKRAREVMEQVCDELAKNIGEDKLKMEELKKESAKIHEEVEKEREMLHVADKLREHRVQMKLSEAKHQYEEKNSAIDKLRKQLESFLGRKKKKETGRAPQSSCDQDMATHSSISSNFALHHDDVNKYDCGEVLDAMEDDASAESDVQSIELNVAKNNKIHNLTPASIVSHDSRRTSVMNAVKGTSSFTGQVPRRSESLLRSISDAVEWDIQAGTARNSLNILGRERLISKQDKQAHRSSCLDETERNQSTMSRRDQVLISNYKAGHIKNFASPTRQWEQPWSIGDHVALEDKSNMILGSHSKSRFC